MDPQIFQEGVQITPLFENLDTSLQAAAKLVDPQNTDWHTRYYTVAMVTSTKTEAFADWDCIYKQFPKKLANYNSLSEPSIE